MSQEAIDALRELKGKKQKAAAIEMIEGDGGWEALSLLQEDSNEKLRKMAVEILSHFGETPPDEVYTAAEKALDDDVSGVRNAALKLLDAVVPRGTVSVKLAELLNVKKARELLTKYGELAIPALVDVLGKGDAKSRKQAIETIAAMGTKARGSASVTEALVEAISDEDKKIRQATFAAISTIGIDLSDHREGLTKAAQTGDDSAAELVKDWGEDALEVFEDMVKFPDPKLRKFGLLHMVDLVKHLEADDDYDVLIGALKDDKAAVQRAALEFFSALPFPVEDALDALDGLYSEPLALQILTRYGDDAIPTYEDMLRSQSPKDRRHFCSIIDELTPEVLAKLATPLLEMAKKEYDSQILALLFAKLPGLDLPKDDVVAALEGHQDSWDENVCKGARDAMKTLGQPTRESPWKECAMSGALKRHFFRLGATFQKPDKKDYKDIEVAQRMCESLFDMQYGISFPHRSWFNTFDSFGEVTLYLKNNSTFSSPKRYSDEERVECVVFAESSMRRFGISLEAERADSVVYMTDHYDEDGDSWDTGWQYSSLSYFLQHFERPKDL